MGSGVYVITNENGNRYIGSGILLNRRWNAHRRSLRLGSHVNPHLQSAWNKYGEGAFRFEVLEECGPEFLISQEQWWINMLHPEYNICQVAGSRLGIRNTPESNAKISATMRGRKRTAEHQANLSASLKGRTVSPETTAKLLAANMGNKHRLGKHHTLETKAKLSAANMGKSPSPEHREKLSVAGMGNKNALGHRHTPETKAKQSVAHKLFWANKRGVV